MGRNKQEFLLSRKLHLTISDRLDSILQNGLLPDAPKLYDTRYSGTPTFGGIYYTQNAFDIPCIVKNLAGIGCLLRNNLVVLSFSGDYQSYADEDDFFTVTDNEFVEYTGPPGLLPKDFIHTLTRTYEKFCAGSKSEQEFLSLKKLMQEFYSRTSHMKHSKGHILSPVMAQDIEVEAILQPMLARNEEIVVWKAVGGKDVGFWKEFLDSLRFLPENIDHYYPWDCILETEEESFSPS